ncbi:MAG: bifunctional phosphopantothenoylcysteine decarboxylase/phosphopantothenate--cysteine ligase CoaBC, partial [Chitinophagaceae bacterium]
MLQGKKILLGITGSIAAYKAALLVRFLVKEGAEVQVVMTPAAAEFITPLTLSTLSHKTVLITLSDKEKWNNHALLGRWADLILIAPASANTLAKMAHGLCDNLLLAVYLSAACPVMIAPAMDEDMWRHPSTKSNIQQLLRNGNLLLPVETGELASGLTGEGRMSEPDTIVKYLEDFLSPRQEPLKGKRVLVTAGPTYEPIDPVRFIGNFSSGKMGIALADEFAAKGAEVNLILGPSLFSPQNGSVRVTRIKTAKEMLDNCLQHFASSDITMMAAAVADYRPQNPA